MKTVKTDLGLQIYDQTFGTSAKVVLMLPASITDKRMGYCPSQQLTYR